VDCGVEEKEGLEEACSLCHDPVIEQELAPFLKSSIRHDHVDLIPLLTCNLCRGPQRSQMNHCENSV
jgi:hypothetical protein